MLIEPGTEYRVVFKKPTDTGEFHQDFTSLELAEESLKHRKAKGAVGRVEYQTLSEWRKVGEEPAEPEPTKADNLLINMTEILQLIVSKWEICRDLRDTMDLAKVALAEAHQLRAVAVKE